MRPRRIYLPLTHDQLRSLATERVLAAPVVGLAPAVTRTDSRTAPATAEEVAEFAAFIAAAERAVSAVGAGRRVIAAADVPPGALEQRSGSGTDGAGATGDPAEGVLEVRTTEDLPLRLIVSLHIDEATDGTGALAGAGPDLLWYDITELDAVVEELGLV